MGGHSIHASDALGDTIFAYEHVIGGELSVRCEDGYAHLLNGNLQNILIRLLCRNYYWADLQCEACEDQVSKKAEHLFYLTDNESDTSANFSTRYEKPDNL